MADRDALREFQSRLAGRLQAARTTGVAASWLAVEAAQQRFLFPLAHAGEIFSWVAPQPVPYTQGWFLGVANLRGGLCGVVDFASLLPGRPVREDIADSPHPQWRLVAVNELLEVNAALLIDRLLGLRGVEAFSGHEPRAEGDPAWFGHVYIDRDGLRWQEIDLQQLAQEARFLDIGA